MRRHAVGKLICIGKQHSGVTRKIDVSESVVAGRHFGELLGKDLIKLII